MNIITRGNRALAILALTGLFGLSALSAQNAKAEPEPDSIEAISTALGIDVADNMCGGSRKSTTATAKMLSMATLAQTKPNRIDPASTVSQKSTAMDHSHIPVAVPEGVPSPRLSATLTRDVMSGYNLRLHIDQYEMTAPPIAVAMENLMAPRINASTGFIQGHAHLYINGEKIQRVYGNSIHIPATQFREGMNQLNITINNHAHMFWTYEDKEIISSLFVNTGTSKLVTYRFDSFPAVIE
ncbi:hypothetical protein GCM10009069_28140 [Algimonas arctica]|uniref:Uncharacterized protein n=1 Tax=Algimonas arctica TaxID=1479486 RepID=A0A8J3CV09_9PROT|nr:hypothetical protein [Algimonas arctica]GHB03918.1 hypothetical protein GCM10009069_28140 [Algimonas arctica]